MGKHYRNVDALILKLNKYNTLKNWKSKKDFRTPTTTTTTKNFIDNCLQVIYLQPTYIPFLNYFFLISISKSSGPRYRRPKEKKEKGDEEKRPRTAFSNEQLGRLKVYIHIIALLIASFLIPHRL